MIREIALDSSAEIETAGFGPVETHPQGRWRWASAANPAIRLPVAAGTHRLSYVLSLAQPEYEVRLAVGGVSASLKARVAGEMVSGSLEFSTTGGILPIQFGAGPAAFAIHAFRLHLNPPQLEDLPEPPADILSRGAPEFFCAYPFRWLFLGQDGKSYPCCYSESFATGRGGDAVSTVRIGEGASMKEAWNSPVLREVRREMLRGHAPAVCRSCQELEQVGAKSARQDFNEAWGQEALALAGASGVDGAISALPRGLDVQIGNTCNLKCRMCAPPYSAAIISDFEAFTGSDFSQFRQSFWRDSPAVKQLAAESEGLVDLNIIGGEPFLEKEYHSLLRELVAAGKSREILLRISSNLTVLPENVRELLAFFRGVQLFVSIEGVGEVNDFIRFPSRFSGIEENLRRLHADPRAWNLASVNFNVTVQAYNVHGLPQLFRYLREVCPEFSWFPHLSMLRLPEELSVNALTPESRAMAAAALEEYLHGFEPGRPLGNVSREVAEARVRSVIRCLAGPDQPELRARFVARHRAFNQMRRQEMPYAIPGMSLP